MQPEISNKRAWFALQVKSRHEFKVCERLTGLGINVFLPAVERLSRWKDRNKLIRFPLFPSYLFVNIVNCQADRTAVLKTNGVVKFLGVIPGEPETVPEEQILSLKKVLEAGINLDPYPYLQVGQRIRITRGPLVGVEGLLVERSGQHKLVLSVNILSQSTSVAIQAADVERI